MEKAGSPNQKTGQDVLFPLAKGSVGLYEQKERLDGVTAGSRIREIIRLIQVAEKSGDLSTSISLLEELNQRTIDISRSSVDAFGNWENCRDLALVLGKISAQQNDKAALEHGWNRSFELPDTKVVSRIPSELRMLMARVALNAGRKQGAARILGQASADSRLDESTIDLVRLAVRCYFEKQDCSRFVAILQKGATDPIRQNILNHYTVCVESIESQ